MSTNRRALHQILFLLFISIWCISCGDKEKESSTKNEDRKQADSPETISNKVKEPDSFPFGLEVFTNMEMVPYCIPLPLETYTIDEDQSNEKAKYIFTNNSNEDFYISIKGLLRSDESVSLEDYYRHSISEEETEAQGKILDQKVLLKDKGCFWVTGYWSNFPEQKFVELTFVRNEDIVNIYWGYDPATEGSDSFKILQEWIKHGSECKE